MTIRTSFDLVDAVERKIKESMKAGLERKALSEKEKQQAMAGAPKGAPPPDAGASPVPSGPTQKDDAPKPSKTADDEAEKLKNADVKAEDIIEKMNSIRSGRSFKDETVASAMDEYINSMSGAERVALLAFLKGIAQIVTGEIPANQASDPADSPADVHMHKGKDSKSQSKHVQPNVIKASPPKAPPKKGVENTAPPAPITPKR